jgi:hypothetical protein
VLRSVLSVVLALAFVAGSFPAAAPPAPSDPELVKGIRQVDEGDYDAAPPSTRGRAASSSAPARPKG